jgi:hypothetical protein
MARAQAGQQMAADAGILRLQEQAAAQNQLSGLYNQMGGQDIQTRGMNDQQVRFYLQQGMDLATAQQRATMDMEQFRVNQANTTARAQAGENARAGGAFGNFLGGLAQAGAKFAAGGATDGGAPAGSNDAGQGRTSGGGQGMAGDYRRPLSSPNEWLKGNGGQAQ